MRALLSEYNCDLKHGQALEVISKLTGHADWNTLSAALKQSPAPEAASAADTCKKCGSPVQHGYCTDISCVYSDYLQDVEYEQITDPQGERPERRMRVPAEIHSDDYRFSGDFYAEAWLAQASDEEILALADEEWRSCEEADSVGYFYEDTNSGIQSLLAYCHATQGSRNSIGFEVSVDERAALEWLRQNRPGLWAQILCRLNEVLLTPLLSRKRQRTWGWAHRTRHQYDITFTSKEGAALDAVKCLDLA